MLYRDMLFQAQMCVPLSVSFCKLHLNNPTTSQERKHFGNVLPTHLKLKACRSELIKLK